MISCMGGRHVDWAETFYLVYYSAYKANAVGFI